ncbi:MAG: glycosyltransferase family 4 protein [Oscillospiraceae bacterium]|nr:glycosyltransferase family 4 protein [Oscillospiraceae bacterium]
MNVLYLIHHAGQGGTERYVLSVALGLRDAGRVNPFFAYTQDGLLRGRMEKAGVPVWRVRLPGRYSLRSAKKLAKLCREHEIDVIHTQFLRENYIALLSRLFYRKPRVVYTNHLIQKNDLITRLSNRVLSPLQHGVIAVCRPGLEQMVRNKIPEKLMSLVHNGVDPAEWARSPDRTVRREFGVPDGLPVILYAARLVEGKGHGYLLKALAGLKDVPFLMLFAGDGDLRGELEALAENSGLGGKTVFLGFREDIREVLSAADVCVNAANTEACSYNILEAMAMGTPQAVADAGGNADLIDGENGLLFRDEDPKALESALRKLLTDAGLRGRCAEKAKQAAKERFHIRDMLDKTYAIYQD